MKAIGITVATVRKPRRKKSATGKTPHGGNDYALPKGFGGGKVKDRGKKRG